MWTLPILVLLITTAVSIPVGYYLAWVYDGRFPRWLHALERPIDTGAQTWKQYALALVLFNTVAALLGMAVLSLQPYLPLNPDKKGMLEASTIFHTAFSFLTNTQQQHYSGEVHFSYFTQLFLVGWMDFIGPAVGLAALAAVVRGLRGDESMGNFYVDLWRGVLFVCLPMGLLMALPLLAEGVPMTLDGAAEASTLEPGAMGVAKDGKNLPQVIARGPVAAVISIKQLGTNGGGYYGANSCHPFENPTALGNFFESVCIILIPFATTFMFGRMLRQMRQAAMLFGVMFALLVAMVGWCVYYDSGCPNPALTAHPAQEYRIPDPTQPGGQRTLSVSAVAGLPVDQRLGNLEGKELRFGTAAGPTWAALATATSNGSVNCMHDSLNPAAGLAPMTGMFLNCIFGGVGTGLLNLLVYVVTAVFLAGLMVGRTPEYLTKKIEAREMKLGMLALLIHPILVLGPTGLFSALDWGSKSTNNPGAHGFSEILYEFTSASANNGSGFEGLGDTYGFNKPEDNPSPPAPYSVHWNIACGLVLLFGRYVPIIAPLALAASVARKAPTPVTSGTLRTDTVTFGFMLLGTILLVGALLFLPAVVLGPVAEHLGPIPFGG